MEEGGKSQVKMLKKLELQSNVCKRQNSRWLT